MSPVTTPPGPPAGALRPGHRATAAHALRAEWTKLWSLRSTAFTLLAFVGLAVGLTALIGSGFSGTYHELTPAEQAEFVPLEVSQLGFQVAFLAVIVLGVLQVTGEYATGMIRPSLAAVPRRGRLLAAKAAVLAVVVLAGATATGFATFFVGQSILASQDVPHAALGDPHVVRAVLGIGLFTTVLGLLSLAAGALLRSTAGGISAMVAGVLVLPNLAGLLPDWWAEQVQRFYPTIAGSQLITVQQEPGTLGPWAGFAVMCAFTAGLLAAAYLLFRRRDA